MSSSVACMGEIWIRPKTRGHLTYARFRVLPSTIEGLRGTSGQSEATIGFSQWAIRDRVALERAAAGLKPKLGPHIKLKVLWHQGVLKVIAKFRSFHTQDDTGRNFRLYSAESLRQHNRRKSHAWDDPSRPLILQTEANSGRLLILEVYASDEPIV